MLPCGHVVPLVLVRPPERVRKPFGFRCLLGVRETLAGLSTYTRPRRFAAGHVYAHTHDMSSQHCTRNLPSARYRCSVGHLRGTTVDR